MKRLVINEAFLQQVESLQTLIRNNVAGLFGGNRKSKSFGSSSEFTDARDYVEGDDVTKIDWNAYARFEKLYIKLYLDERQMHTRIYVDASRSMDHGKGSKAEQALMLAATFAYLSVCEMDKVSVYAVKGKQITEVIGGIVGRDAYFETVGRLNDIEFGGDSYISDAILPTNVGYGDGLSIIISDFLTDNDFEYAIDHLVAKKRDVFCAQILSKDELYPQIRGKSHLFDSEDSLKFYRKNIDRDIAEAYRRALEYSTDRIKSYCVSRGGEYLLVPAEQSVSEVFFSMLVDGGVLK